MTYLYRCFDIDGVLLYVGISLSTISRMNEHRRAEWFDRCSQIEIEHHDTRAGALEAEAKAIIDECPAHNVIHSTINHRKPSPDLKDLLKARREDPMTLVERRAAKHSNQ